MVPNPPSQAELYEIFTSVATTDAPELTDLNDGSKLDSIAGAVSLVGEELGKLISAEFAKTFFRTAHGPDITGGPDDLQTLAVDHFGDRFARPGATKALGVVTFSRPTNVAGNVSIAAGTIVKTDPDANGKTQRFETILPTVLSGLSINASVRAVEAGPDGDADPGTVTTIESTLSDSSVVVTNSASFVGGKPAQDDATYQQTIRDLVETLRGATKAAIEATAKTVAGVETATAVERMIVVREWNIANDAPESGSLYFRIPEAILYIADANGTASAPLIAAVEAAIEPVRAAGVRIQIRGASAFTINWSASYTLDTGGPNYTALLADSSPVEQSMEDYIQKLPIGTGFDRGLANNAILAIWGPAGTGDLVAGGFQTLVPVGNVAASSTTKLIPGTVGIN